MRDPSDPPAPEATETLQAGPTRPPLLEGIPPRWRTPAVALLAFALGVSTVGVATLTRPDRTASRTPTADEHALELVLFHAVPPRTPPRRWLSGDAPLRVDSAVLLSGAVTSTVDEITGPTDGLAVRVPGLPVTVSPTARFRSVVLEITIRDCGEATKWRPTQRPFLISWTDEYDRAHLDRAGDFDRALASSLTRYIRTACRDRRHR